MERKIIHDNGRTWAPHCESNFEFFLRIIFLAVKMISSVVQKIFPTGIDGKTIIKKEPDVESPERRCKKIKG